jgi:hypothetical protein
VGVTWVFEMLVGFKYIWVDMLEALLRIEEQFAMFFNKIGILWDDCIKLYNYLKADVYLFVPHIQVVSEIRS